MPITVSHALSMTTPDDPAYENKPSNWNETHAATFNAVGSEISGAFSNGGGVTFGLETNGFITAAAPAGGGGITNINLSAGSTSNNLSAFQFSNGSGVTFGLNGSTITASVQTNYLTTAMASNRGSDFVQATAAFAGTNASGTIASNGISVSVAAPVAQTAFVFSNSNGVSFGTNGSTVTATVATNYQSQGAYLTTAMQSNAVTLSNIRVSGGTTSNLLSAITFANSNGVSFGLNAGTMTASHNGLTTARASNDGVGLATAQSNVTWTVNSAGLSLDARGYAGTATTFNGANISGSMTVNSNGVNLSLSAAAPGGGGAINVTAGTTSGNLQTIEFSNANGVTFGLDGSTVTASVNAGGGAAITYSGMNHYNDLVQVAGQVGQGTLQFDPVRVENDFQMDRFCVPLINTNATNSSGSHTVSIWIGLYTRNGNTLSLYQSASSSTAVTHSGTVGSYSLYSGIRLFTIPFSSTIPPNDYWVGFLSRTTSGGANGTYSNLLASNLNSNFLGMFGSSHNTTYQMTIGQGVYSATRSSLLDSVGFTQIRGSDSQAFRAPIVIMAYSTV